MSNRKYFIHGANGKDDDISCTHPLVTQIQLIKNFENAVGRPNYQIAVYFKPRYNNWKLIEGSDKPILFGGAFVSSAIEFADNYLKTVFPFDTFTISQTGKTLELLNDYGNLITVTAKAGDKYVSQNIDSKEFIKLIATVLNNIPASEPCGEVKPLMDIFMEKLSEK